MIFDRVKGLTMLKFSAIKFMKIIGLTLTLILGVSIPNTWGIDLEYPELQVTPRASARIAMEAKRELGKSSFGSWPMQTSAALTFLSGVWQFSEADEKEDPDGHSAIIGAAVGGFWLGINYYLAAVYNPYLAAKKELSTITGNSKRQQLTRERMAEEKIKYLGRLGRKLKWFSFLSNGAASIYMLSKVEKDSKAEIVQAISIIASLGPLFFESDWERIRREQRSYKKRIYTPVVNAGLLPVKVSQSTVKLAPGARLTWSF